MRKYLFTLLLAAGALTPAPTRAQGLGLAARGGTLGFGGELAIGATDRFVMRGGIGLTPFEPNATFDGIDVRVSIPTWYNAGVDLYLNGAARLGGGVLFKSGEHRIEGELDSPQDIGGTVFTPAEIGTLTGVIDSPEPIPYVLVGFGKHTAPGYGLFIDLGVAFIGDSEITLASSGGTLSDDPATQEALDREAQNFEENMPTYLKFWPILSLGLRIGFG